MKDKTLVERNSVSSRIWQTCLWDNGFMRLFILSMVFLIAGVPVAYSQEESEDKDKITDLPPVKIEIVDTTQINIPREKFHSFTTPDSKIYAPAGSKEKPWYLPNTSIPDKVGYEKTKAVNDSLLLLSAQAGVPVAFSYQMLLVKGFSNSEVLAEVGRTTLKTGRTPSKQGDSNADKLKGAFAYQGDSSNIRTDIQYNARDIEYQTENGENLPNERSLANLFADLDFNLYKKTSFSLGMDLSSLRMDGPLSSGKENGLELETDFKMQTSWPGTNPIETGLGVEYFDGVSDISDFKEAIIKIHLRDNDVRIWYFVLGLGAELMLDLYNDVKIEEKWKANIYPNPYLLITSRIGNRTVLQLGIERYILRQNLKDLYIDKDSVRYNPNLSNERIWDLNASLQYKMAGKFTGTIKAFDKEIRNLTIFEKSEEEILSWSPDSLDSARISGIASQIELIFLEGKLKQNFQYVYETHDIKIPYRPKSKGSVALTYFAPYDFEPSITAEFYSRRYIGADSNESLSSYLIWKPKISKAFGKYASVFLGAELYTGKSKYQIWDGYELPDLTVDFGAKLKF